MRDVGPHFCKPVHVAYANNAHAYPWHPPPAAWPLDDAPWGGGWQGNNGKMGGKMGGVGQQWSMWPGKMGGKMGKDGKGGKAKDGMGGKIGKDGKNGKDGKGQGGQGQGGQLTWAERQFQVLRDRIEIQEVHSQLLYARLDTVLSHRRCGHQMIK